MRFASLEDAQAYYNQYGNFDGPNAPSGGPNPQDPRYVVSDAFPTGGPSQSELDSFRRQVEMDRLRREAYNQAIPPQDDRSMTGQTGLMQGPNMMDALYGRGRTQNPFGLGTGGSPFTQPYFGAGGGAGKGGGNPYAPRGGALFGQNFSQPSYGGGKGGGMSPGQTYQPYTPAGFGPRFNNMGGGGGKFGGGRGNMGRDYMGYGNTPSNLLGSGIAGIGLYNQAVSGGNQSPVGGMYG